MSTQGLLTQENREGACNSCAVNSYIALHALDTKLAWFLVLRGGGKGAPGVYCVRMHVKVQKILGKPYIYH